MFEAWGDQFDADAFVAAGRETWEARPIANKSELGNRVVTWSPPWTRKLSPQEQVNVALNFCEANLKTLRKLRRQVDAMRFDFIVNCHDTHSQHIGLGVIPRELVGYLAKFSIDVAVYCQRSPEWCDQQRNSGTM